MLSGAPHEQVDQVDRVWRPILLYATAIDTKQFGLMHEVFTSDAVADYGERVLHGPGEVEERMTLVHQHIHGSRHRLSNARVVDWTPTSVRTITYVEAFLVGGPRATPWTYRDVGSYHDVLVPAVTGGAPGWLISERRYERLWREGDVMAIATYPPDHTHRSN